MANANAPFGFRWVYDYNGGEPYIRRFVKPASDANAIGRGDLVDITGAAGTVARGVAGGSFVGISLSFGAASKNTVHDVQILSERSVCIAQEDSVGGAIPADNEGLNANIIVAAPNTQTGLSQMQIDSSTAAALNTLDLRLLQPLPRVGNTVGLNNAIWAVLVNDLRLADQKAGI